MATRSLIGRCCEESNTVVHVYCHFDGYIEGVGRILQDHWTNRKDIERLLNMGALNILGNNIGERTFINTSNPFFNDLRGDQCVFYRRDIRIPADRLMDTQCMTFPHRQTLASMRMEWGNKVKDHRTWWPDYLYLFCDNEWWINNLDHDRWNLLSEELKAT